MYQEKTTRPHTGWSAEEDALLLEKAASAQQSGRPMRAVFEEMAAASGRRPNSVRNYYYARVKTDAGRTIAHSPAFVPFTGEESRRLLADVLSAQAAGESVRACTLRLASGDDRRMLRYQNKYRQLIKSDPALVRSVLASLAKRGLPAFDPYAPPAGKKRAGRPRKQPREMTELLELLSRVEGLDTPALLRALGALAQGAVNGAEALSGAAEARRALESARAEHSRLAQENEALRAQLARAGESLSAQQERYLSLLGYFRQLIRVNTEFLKTDPAGKRAELSGYLRDLQTSVASCEKLMVEANL